LAREWEPGWLEPSRVVRQWSRRQSRSAEALGRAGALGSRLTEAPGVTGRAACSGRIPGGVPGPRRHPRLGRTFAEDVVDAEGAIAPFDVKTRACRIRSSCSVCLLRPPRPEKHTLAALVKLRLFSSCFEHLDPVSNRDVYASESCFSRKGRVRYPYPRGVGIPRLGRPCRLRILSPVHEALSPT
jgi:hypothetical protein